MAKTLPAVATSLPRLAKRINAEHTSAARALKAGLQHALEAGRLLLEAKAQVEHGQWLEWLKGNCDFPDRLAQKYMRVAREFSRGDLANTPRVAELSFRQSLDLVTKNNMDLRRIPESKRGEALAMTEEGRTRNLHQACVQLTRPPTMSVVFIMTPNGPSNKLRDFEEQRRKEERLQALKDQIAARPEYAARIKAIEALQAKEEEAYNNLEAIRTRLFSEQSKLGNAMRVAIERELALQPV